MIVCSTSTFFSGCEQTVTKGELLTGGFGMFWLVLRNTGGARQSQ